MTYQLYKMKFHSAHFGARILEKSNDSIPVETLFSALFLEALKLGKEQQFLSRALESDYALSDTMLYRFGILLPKPIGYPNIETAPIANENSRKIAKTVKNIDYIHEMDFLDFIKGKITSLNKVSDLANEQKNLYKISTTTRVHDDPYRVGITTFSEDTFLSFIGTKDSLTEELMESLQYTGLGGKRTSGLGRFVFETEPLDIDLTERLKFKNGHPLMLLNSALPRENELSKVMKNATFLLKKSSGFAYSQSVKENYRKQNLYKFKAGSVFHQTFEGDIFNVAPEKFPHPVWNYAKPLFLSLEGVKDGKN